MSDSLTFEITETEPSPTGGVLLERETDFTVTARSRTEQLGNLFDGNTSTYYQTNASCPHWITFEFTGKLDILGFVMYHQSSDESYSPERISLENPDVGEKQFCQFPHQTGWCWVPLRWSGVRTLKFAVERNHSGGCDCKIRQIMIFKSLPTQRSDAFVHQKCFFRDLETLYSDRTNADLELYCSPEGSEPLVCHSAVVVQRSGYISAALRSLDSRTPPIKLELQMVPRELMVLFVDFAYRGPQVITSVLSSSASMPAFHVPQKVLDSFGPVASIYSLARFLLCEELSRVCEDFIISIATRRQPPEVWQWLSSAGTDDINERIGIMFASNRTLLKNEGVHNTLTARQLKFLVQYAMRVMDADTVKKDSYVKIKQGASKPAPMTEVGIVTNVTRSDDGEVYTVDFPTLKGWMGPRSDLVIVSMSS